MAAAAGTQTRTREWTSEPNPAPDNREAGYRIAVVVDQFLR